MSVMNIIAARAICSQSVIFRVEDMGLYYVTVFHEEDGDGILGAEVYFSMEFQVKNSDTTSVPTGNNQSSATASTCTFNLLIIVFTCNYEKEDLVP